jgi:2-dehydropantoate 2-reductase
MMEMAFVGAGGVGGYFGGLLARKGLKVHFVARGRHRNAILDRGLRVEAASGTFTVSPASVEEDARAVPHCDFVFLCVKNYDLEETLRALEPFAGTRACFVPLLNGVDAARKLEAMFPGRTIAAQCSVLSEILEPGVIRQANGPQQIVLGEPCHRRTERMDILADTFSGTGAEVLMSETIERELWSKLIFISCLAGVVAATRSTIGEVLACPQTRALCVTALQEAVVVADAEGIALDSSLVEATMRRAEALEPGSRFSLLRDLEAGKRSEIDSLNGTIVRCGLERGVATPVHSFIYAALLPTHLRGQGAAKGTL